MLIAESECCIDEGRPQPTRRSRLRPRDVRIGGIRPVAVDRFFTSQRHDRGLSRNGPERLVRERGWVLDVALRHSEDMVFAAHPQSGERAGGADAAAREEE